MSDMGDFLRVMRGCSVTQRIEQVKQPRGGYINPKQLKSERLGDGIDVLNPEENINAGLMGLAVDYMTRFMSGTSAEEAFRISLWGAPLVDEADKASGLLAGIKGLDDGSIVNAVKLVGFDVCFRAGVMGYKPVDDINPDAATVQNVRTMVERSLHFLNEYGPKVLDGFTFEGGYTDTVDTGDGDFTTADTLWDFKVSKMPIKKEHTLQLLMYWRHGPAFGSSRVSERQVPRHLQPEDERGVTHRGCRHPAGRDLRGRVGSHRLLGPWDQVTTGPSSRSRQRVFSRR